MKRIFLFVLATVVLPIHANALVYCTVSDFELEVYDSGAAYMHTTIGGSMRNWIKACTYVPGQTSGVQDCSTNGSSARISVIMSAFAMGKDLQLAFEKDNSGNTIASCSAVANYSHPVIIRIKR